MRFDARFFTNPTSIIPFHFVLIICFENKIPFHFVLVFAVFTQFLSFSGFVKVFCFGKIRKCIFLTKKIRRTSGNSISQKLREFDFFSYIHIYFCSIVCHYKNIYTIYTIHHANGMVLYKRELV